MLSACRLNRFGKALIIAVVLATIGGVYSQKLHLLRGDFPAFYSAAVLAGSSATADELYGEGRQQEIQLRHWPEMKDEFLMFSYPASVAVVLAPLSQVGGITAKYIFTAIAFLLAAIFLFQCSRFSLVNSPWFSAGLAISFLPFLSAVTSGQLSIILFLALLAIASELSDREEGVRTGRLVVPFLLLGFKPNVLLAAATAAFFLLSSGKRVLIIPLSLLVLFAHYLVGASIFSWDWPLVWFKATASFAEKDFIANGHMQSSAVDLLSNFYRYLTGDSLAFLLVVALSLMLIAVLARLYRRKLPAPVLFILLVCLGTVHFLYYDLGVLSAMFWLAASKNKRDVTWMLLTWVSVNALIVVKGSLPFQPAVIVVLAFVLYGDSLYRHQKDKMVGDG